MRPAGCRRACKQQCPHALPALVTPAALHVPDLPHRPRRPPPLPPRPLPACCWSAASSGRWASTCRTTSTTRTSGAQCRVQGRAQGRARGRAQGRAQGGMARLRPAGGRAADSQQHTARLPQHFGLHEWRHTAEQLGEGGGVQHRSVSCQADVASHWPLLPASCLPHACPPPSPSVSDDLLRSYLDAYPTTPWPALKYLVAEANYGGRVTDEMDRRVLACYMDKWAGRERRGARGGACQRARLRRRVRHDSFQAVPRWTPTCRPRAVTPPDQVLLRRRPGHAGLQAVAPGHLPYPRAGRPRRLQGPHRRPAPGRQVRDAHSRRGLDGGPRVPKAAARLKQRRSKGTCRALFRAGSVPSQRARACLHHAHPPQARGVWAAPQR